METIISVRLNKFVLKEIANIEKTWHADRSEVIRRLLAELEMTRQDYYNV